MPLRQKAPLGGGQRCETVGQRTDQPGQALGLVGAFNEACFAVRMCGVCPGLCLALGHDAPVGGRQADKAVSQGANQPGQPLGRVPAVQAAHHTLRMGGV